ncbi:MAG: PilN domain-containing protein [Candidatus Pacebacteria bacterium]|nr:PilN domain-containing protein [Candidatus Paceibacterota bacterium]
MINLLPPNEKQVILKNQQFNQVFILGILFLFFCLLLGLILFFIKTDMQQKIVLQENLLHKEQRKVESLNIKNLEEEIRSLNTIFTRLEYFYKERYYLTSSFENLFKTVPKDLYFINLSFNNKEVKKFSISGFSPNRQTLLEFKTNLESQKVFKEIYFPPSNWLKSENIDFIASFRINE